MHTQAVGEILTGAAPDSNPTLKIGGKVLDRIRTCAHDLVPRNDCAALDDFVAEHEAYRHSLPADAKGTALATAAVWTAKTTEIRLHPPQWMVRIGLPFSDSNVHSDNELANLISSFCKERTLISTMTGRLALVSEDARAGDAIVCFCGVGVPFVLRGPVSRPKVQKEDEEELDGAEGESWRIVAEAWVWGLMDGEVWELEGPGQVETKDLYIC